MNHLPVTGTSPTKMQHTRHRYNVFQGHHILLPQKCEDVNMALTFFSLKKLKLQIKIKMTTSITMC